MSTIVDRLRPLWCEVVKTDEVSADADFIKSGGTSLGAVHLAAGIQDEFGVVVDAIDILEQGSFRNITELIGKRL